MDVATMVYSIVLKDAATMLVSNAMTRIRRSNQRKKSQKSQNNQRKQNQKKKKPQLLNTKMDHFLRSPL
jgi:hypothetical protein